MTESLAASPSTLLAGLAQTIGHGGYGLLMISAYLAMLLIERTAYLFERNRRWAERESLANMLNWIVLALFEGAIGAALFVSVYLWVFEHRLFTIPSAPWGWLLAFLLNDLAYYTSHRIEHRTGFFWAIRMAHHSSETMNLTVAARNSLLLMSGASQPIYYLLAFFGLPLPMFLVARFAGNVWGIFNHTRLIQRLGWLERWIATPANHRVHHGIQPKYLDRNYGQVLMIWDRLFGTFQPEEEEPVYGLVHQMGSTRIYDIQTWGARWLIGQVRSAPSWRDKFAYLIKPPGWRHDGRHETTESIQVGAVPA